MRLRAIFIALFVTLLGATASRPARADQLSASKKAAAETLFEEGKRLRKDGNFLEAARKFEQVQKLDPGIGTLLHLADSYEHAGRLASAWGNYSEAAQYARTQKDSREQLAIKLAEKLSGKLARLSIDVGQNETILRLIVSRNGVELDASTAEVAIPFDAGPVTIEIRAPGYRTHQQEIVLKDGEQRNVTLPPLVALPKTLELDPARTASLKPEAPARVRSNAQDRVRNGALALGLGALASAGVAGGFALRALKLDDDAAQYCVGLSCSDIQGEALSHDARQAGSIATTAVALAAITGSGAIGLFVGSFFVHSTTPAVALRVTPWADRQSSGVLLGGTW